MILALLLLIGAPAVALPLGDFGITNPIWFPFGGGNTGVGSVPIPDYALDPSSQFLCAGGGVFTASGACSGLTDYQLRVLSQDLQLPAIQFPQGDGTALSSNDPLIVDSIWTVLNNTAVTLLDTILIFTNVDLTDFPGSLVPGGYWDRLNFDGTASTPYAPDSAFGLDADILKIMEFSSGGNDFYYGVGRLGDLLPGETAEITLRYIVNNGPMPFDGNDVVLPPLGLLGATVPEPSTLLLLGSGLLGLVIATRRRS